MANVVEAENAFRIVIASSANLNHARLTVRENSDPDSAVARAAKQCAMQAMMKMKKLDIAELECAAKS
jgi:hypothetical protein